jgi:hypothetical protein
VIGTETMLASAFLSTLISKGHVKVSHRKIGSSPLYYVDGQEQKTRDVLYSELNDLEKKALERLRELRVAFKDELYPQERVLLSDLRDFAAYLQITNEAQEFVCWKYYSVTDDEFNSILNSKLNKQEEPAIIVEHGEVILGEEPEQKLLAKTKIFDSEPKIEPKEIVVKKKREPKIHQSDFDLKVDEYLKNANIEVLEKNIGHGESSYLVSTKTPFGHQNYFLKTKNKSLTESDISKIYVETSSKKYPIILFTPKQLNKKVKAYVEKHFGNLIKIIILEK